MNEVFRLGVVSRVEVARVELAAFRPFPLHFLDTIKILSSHLSEPRLWHSFGRRRRFLALSSRCCWQQPPLLRRWIPSLLRHFLRLDSSPFDLWSSFLLHAKRSRRFCNGKKTKNLLFNVVFPFLRTGRQSTVKTKSTHREREKCRGSQDVWTAPSCAVRGGWTKNGWAGDGLGIGSAGSRHQKHQVTCAKPENTCPFSLLCQACPCGGGGGGGGPDSPLVAVALQLNHSLHFIDEK